MWPPMPSKYLLALVTIIIAFQRITSCRRFSSTKSPGYAPWAAGEIVLTYGVLTRSISTPDSLAAFTVASNILLASLSPSWLLTAKIESIHS